MAVARQPLEAAAVDLDPPQLEAALDRRGEDEPPAVGHPAQPIRPAAEQVAVHAGRGLEVRSGDQVLGQPVAHAEAPDRCLVEPPALPVAEADGARPSVRPATTPAHPTPGGRAPGESWLTRLGGDVDAGRCPSASRGRRRDGDPRRTRCDARPATTRGSSVVAVAAGQQLGRAGCHVDDPQVLELVVDEPGAVELVEERVDQPRVGLRRILRLALGLLLRLGRGRAAHDAQAPAVRRPGEALDVLRQVGQLARLAAIGEREQPDLRAALLRRLGLARPSRRRRRPGGRRRGRRGRRSCVRPGSSAASCRSCCRRSAGVPAPSRRPARPTAPLR